MLSKPFIIVDIGSNWRGKLDIALKQIQAAAECGADAVKFQRFTHKELYGVDGPTDFHLPEAFLPLLQIECGNQGKEFMCTAFSADGVRQVDPYVKTHKVASAEAMHTGILDAVVATGKPFLVSLGGATEPDLLWLQRYLNPKAMHRWWALECVASYPAAPEDYNLSVLGFPIIGISDHTTTNELSLIAAGAGATVFEKHFDALKGAAPETPDSPHSLGLMEMIDYVDGIRLAFRMMGDRDKAPSKSEADFVRRYRRAMGPDTFRRG